MAEGLITPAVGTRDRPAEELGALDREHGRSSQEGRPVVFAEIGTGAVHCVRHSGNGRRIA
jgi:hypothetical protein